MSRRRGTRIVLKLFVLIVLIGAGLTIGFHFKAKNGASTLNYREVTVVRGEITIKALSPGVVQPENRLEIKPPVAGRIEDVLCDEGDLVEKGRILAWISSTERAALLDAARARGLEELKRWEDFYKATPVVAPIDGTIIVRAVEPGQTVTNQDALLIMSDRLTVKAQVDETDIAGISLNQAASITLDAYPNDVIPGQVVQIAFEATTVNNVTTYTVDVLPQEIPEFMRSGMTANVSFDLMSRSDILIVPSEAVKTSGNRAWVLLKDNTGSQQPLERDVKIGLSDGKHTEVLEGLTEKDAILVAQLKEQELPASSPFTPFGSRRTR